MSFRISLGAALIALSSFAGAAVAQDVMQWETDLAKAQKIAAETNRLVLVHFWGTWCPPCMKMEHEVFSKPGLGTALTPFFVPVKVQVENGMNENLVKQFAVDGFPCDIVMTPQGQVVAKSKGYKPADQYVAQLQQAAQQAVAQARPVAAPSGAAGNNVAANNVATNGAMPPSQSTVAAIPVVPLPTGPTPTPTPTSAPVAANAAMPTAKPAMTDDRYAYYYQSKPAAPVAAAPAPAVAASVPPIAAPPVAAPLVASVPTPTPTPTPVAAAPIAPAPQTPVAPPVAATPYGNSLSGVPSKSTPPHAPAGGINGAVTKPAAATSPSLLAQQPNRPTVPTAPTVPAPVAPPPAVVANPPVAATPPATAPSPSAIPTPPAPAPVTPAAPVASTPAPIASTPAPVAQAPATPTPVVPAPVAPAPVASVPAPVATAPVAQAPIAQAPVAPAPAAATPAVAPPSIPSASAAISSAVVQSQQPPQVPLPPGCPPLALDGYCPVCLSEKMVWTRGDVKFGAIHKGRTYLFASAAEQKKFLDDPERFSPIISGNDPVIALEQGRTVAGKREYGLMCQDRMFLFSGKESYDRFCSDPKRYSTQIFQAMQAVDGPIRR